MSPAPWVKSCQEQPRRRGPASLSWLGSPEPSFCGLETTATTLFLGSRPSSVASSMGQIVPGTASSQRAGVPIVAGLSRAQFLRSGDHSHDAVPWQQRSACATIEAIPGSGFPGRYGSTDQTRRRLARTRTGQARTASIRVLPRIAQAWPIILGSRWSIKTVGEKGGTTGGRPMRAPRCRLRLAVRPPGLLCSLDISHLWEANMGQYDRSSKWLIQPYGKSLLSWLSARYSLDLGLMMICYS